VFVFFRKMPNPFPL